MALSVRTRFEVFKRDEFTCRYCGRRSPEVVLEVDHIVPVCQGGTDDPMNLATSCWECNSGKSGVPLSTVMTGEDPHDKAIEMAERQRQLAEYNFILEREREHREAQAWELVRYWLEEKGELTDEQRKGAPLTINRFDFRWLCSALKWCPPIVIREFMEVAVHRYRTRDLKYVAGCCRNWREQNMPQPMELNADALGTD